MQTQSQSVSETNRPTGSFALGVLYVILGSSSYGMLSTFVKIAYKHGYTISEVTLAQLTIGALALTAMAARLPKTVPRASRAEARNLILSGIPMGLTSVFYYASVQYIAASVAVVLLMQSVWIGVVAEAVQKRQWPTFSKLIAVALILLGTVFATNALEASAQLDVRGLALGFLSALSFSSTLYASSAVAKHLPPVKRSQLMLYGGTLVVVLFAICTQLAPHYLGLQLLSDGWTHKKAFDPSIFVNYGLFVAVFGTIIPPIMMNKGFPIVGVGLGSILSSTELPVAVMISFLLLHEPVSLVQWGGVLTILFAIYLLNYRVLSSRRV